MLVPIIQLDDALLELDDAWLRGSLNSCLPWWSLNVAPSQISSPERPLGSATMALTVDGAAVYSASTIPLGVGIPAERCFMAPRCGSIFTAANPGAAGRMPATVVRKS